MVQLDKPINNPYWSLSDNPPEYWAMCIYQEDTKCRYIHRVDIWQVGLAWAHLLFAPCAWARKSYFGNVYQMTKRNLLAIGDNETFFPVNATTDADLAYMAFQNRQTLLDILNTSMPFQPPLVNPPFSKTPHREKSWFMNNPNVPDTLDLLRSMLRVSHRSRPTCNVLLQHPFFFKVHNSKVEENREGVEAVLTEQKILHGI